MKKSKILGIGLTIALVLSLGAVFMAAPVAAGEDEWSDYGAPGQAAAGDYFMGGAGVNAFTAGVGPIDRDIDGNFWAYAQIGAGNDHIMKSMDAEGRTWDVTTYDADFPAGGPIVAIQCSPLDADVAYAASAATVYKTEDGGDSWAEVGNAALLVDGVAAACAISDLAVGWDNDDDARVFITANSVTPQGKVFYMYDVAFGANWTALNVDVAGAGPTAVNSISVSPDFGDDAFQAVTAVSATDTYLAYHVGSDPGGWDDMNIDDDAAAAFVAAGGSKPMYPSDFNGDDFYDEDTEVFVGIDGALHAASGDGGVVRIYGTTAGDYEILDDVDADIASLASIGGLGDMQFLAGEAADNDVWYSWDDGDSFEQASAEGINPAGGAVDTYVFMDENFDEDAGIGWAGTGVAKGGLHMSIDGGTSWQGVGLLDSDIDVIAAFDLIVSPETVYLVTDDIAGGNAEVYRYDAAAETWERIYEQTTQYAGLGTMDDRCLRRYRSPCRCWHRKYGCIWRWRTDFRRAR